MLLTFEPDHTDVDICVTSDGRVLVLRDREAPVPRDGTVRGNGLWLSLVEEEPGRWSLALEAFALHVDDPADEVGVPTPLGLDLEWEAGVLHGEVLTDLGAEPVETAATVAVG